jgi:transcription termination factor NusB
MSNGNSYKLVSFADDFDRFCDLNTLIKIAFIKKKPNGKWVILSRKGKELGEYKTKEQAVKRLREIEYFSSKKASKNEEDSYSSIMRMLNRSYDKDVIDKFQKTFKNVFDDEILNGAEKPEKKALEEALKCVSSKEVSIKKVAVAIEMGDPSSAGNYLAQLIRFILKRISPERRPKSIDSLKRKIYYINEFDLGGKKMPAGAAIGQSITLLKTLLIEHSPTYIREVLNSIVRSL